MTEKAYHPIKKVNLIIDRSFDIGTSETIMSNISEVVSFLGGSLTNNKNPISLEPFRSNISLVTGDTISIDKILEENLNDGRVITNGGFFSQFGNILYGELSSNFYDVDEIRLYGKNSVLNALNLVLTNYPLDLGIGSTSMARLGTNFGQDYVRPIGIVSSSGLDYEALGTIVVHELGHMLGSVDEESVTKGYRTRNFDLNDGTGGHCTTRSCIMSQEPSLISWYNKAKRLTNSQSKFISNPFCEECARTIDKYQKAQYFE